MSPRQKKTTTKLFIDKFRRKRKSSEQRKTTREFFSPTKSTKHKSQKETTVILDGVEIVGAMCEGASENSLKN